MIATSLDFDKPGKLRAPSLTQEGDCVAVIAQRVHEKTVREA